MCARLLTTVSKIPKPHRGHILSLAALPEIRPSHHQVAPCRCQALLTPECVRDHWVQCRRAGLSAVDEVILHV